jgi:GR25 family glycosyltransferase involved in LPS biosynthesis
MNNPKLKIGINVHIDNSVFSNSATTAAFSLAEALKSLGHEVVLINTNRTREWFEDCHALKEKYAVKHLSALSDQVADLFVDIDGNISPENRKKVAKRSVIFIRRPVAITEIENSVYPLNGPTRSFEGCDAVWVWDHFGKQDAHILELLSNKPVYRISYTWSPVLTEAGKLEGRETADKRGSEDESWTCRIFETNQSTWSNLTLPFVMISYAKKHEKINMTRCVAHNTSLIEKQPFFIDNVLEHCKQESLNFEFVGRQRVCDWSKVSKTFILSHIRFVTINARLLDAVWNGIPVVHNSPWLRDLGHGLERLYYSDNSIVESTKAIETMVADYEAKVGFFEEGALTKIREEMLKRLSVVGKSWEAAIEGGMVEAAVEAVVDAEKAEKATKAIKTELVVGLCDFWDAFNYDYNFWAIFLQEACNKLQNPLKVRVFQVTPETLNEPMDLLIYSSYTDLWKQVPSHVPKVHFTGENVPSQFGNGTYLNLDFEDTDPKRGIFRLPLWLLYIDWFGANQERIVNPKSMPIDCVAKVDPEMLKAKDKFCAFIVSNPGNPIRNNAFQALSMYKHIDSAGRLFNNVGGDIFTNVGGGGGGELMKLEFLKKYRFCITYENNRNRGYITEKILAAKAAGCVPIYWGALNILDDFPEGSFINANNFESASELINAVREMDECYDAWFKAASIPAVDVNKCRKWLADAAKLILTPILGEEVVRQIPEMIGGATTEEAKKLGEAREGREGRAEKPLAILEKAKEILADEVQGAFAEKPLEKIEWNNKTLLVTFATNRFMQSLATWLGCVELRMKHDKTLSARVYIGDDVTTDLLNFFRAEHPSVEFKRVPSKSLKVDGFPDLWEPLHYAWKLWIYQQVAQEEALQNTLIWYMDCASIIVRWPTKWLQTAVEKGVCFLEDSEQKNDQWCHETFCMALNVTEEELQAQQVFGGIVALVGGAPMAWNLFREAWVYGQQRKVIVGPKWAGLLPDGRPFGHRHDQSILSILRLRYKAPVRPHLEVYNHDSLRRTFKAGAALYVHRGALREHNNFAERIGEVHIISLARRADRIQRFKTNHGPWTKEVCLRPAFDGKTLQMTPALARVFAPNNFMWKKNVMGCSLSHLSLWVELASEQESCENYLILEDDVKFDPSWLEVWGEAAKEIPEDYDVLYLGGVLPPNRGILPNVTENVNQFWARVAPNQFFGQNPATRYFHFCAYSYILSRKGAQKILNAIEKRGGYYAVSDHMICNDPEDMKIYFLTPQIAGCYQDEDPNYANSQFNNYSRVDTFDSDLWNNDERFDEKEVRECLEQVDFTKPVYESILKALAPAPAAAPTPSTHVPVPTKAKKIVIEEVEDEAEEPKKFYTIGFDLNKDALMEYKWLCELFGVDIASNCARLGEDHEPLSSNPVFLYMKPYCQVYCEIFEKYEANQKGFSVVHLSDEYASDPIYWYNYNSCKKIIRTYPIITENPFLKEKLINIPLGPYRIPSGDVSKDLVNRDLVWSFFGTSWKEREAFLEPWKTLKPHKLFLQDEWKGHTSTNGAEYEEACLSSKFVLCPPGQNVETFRFWEALEHGAIPIYIRQPNDGAYFAMISKKLPLLSLDSCNHAIGFVQSLLQNNQTLMQYRKTMLDKWLLWKKELKDAISKTKSM